MFTAMSLLVLVLIGCSIPPVVGQQSPSSSECVQACVASFAPPQPPPLQAGAVITGQVAVAGDATDFDEAAIRTSLASLLGISEDNLVLTITAGSIVIDFAAIMPDAAGAEQALSALDQDTGALSTMLGVQVTAVDNVVADYIQTANVGFGAVQNSFNLADLEKYLTIGLLQCSNEI